MSKENTELKLIECQLTIKVLALCSKDVPMIESELENLEINLEWGKVKEVSLGEFKVSTAKLTPVSDGSNS